MPMSHIACEGAPSARAQRGRLSVSGLTVLLCLADLGFIDAGAVAQEFAGEYGRRTAMGLTVLTLEDEKVKAAKPASEFRECASGCPIMIVIPAGKFHNGLAGKRAGPAHQRRSTARGGARAAVRRFQVRGDIRRMGCLRCRDWVPASSRSFGRGDMPVINMSWNDAKQYVAWLSQSTGKEYRLLTEAEWEFAARAGAKIRYSWGDDPRAGNANCDGCGSPWDLKHTAPIGSLKPNAFGLHDMHGNVWEWVEDTWHQTYDGAPTDGSAWLRGGDPSYRVFRGGSWRNESEQVRAAVRFRRNINVRFDTLGFRVARTIKP